MIYILIADEWVEGEWVHDSWGLKHRWYEKSSPVKCGHIAIDGINNNTDGLPIKIVEIKIMIKDIIVLFLLLLLPYQII